jgi:hypothetical protein
MVRRWKIGRWDGEKVGGWEGEKIDRKVEVGMRRA